MIRGFCQHTSQAHREIGGNDVSLRAHTLHTVEDKHKHRTCSRKRHGKNDRNGVGAKEDKCRRFWNSLKRGQSTTYLYPANAGEVGPQSRDSEGVVWWWGGKGVYFEVHVEASFGKNALLRWHFTQKRQAKGLDHLMHAIGVGRERASNPYPFG